MFFHLFPLLFTASKFEESDQKEFLQACFAIQRKTGYWFQVFFIFHNLMHKKGLGAKEKVMLTF